MTCPYICGLGENLWLQLWQLVYYYSNYFVVFLQFLGRYLLRCVMYIGWNFPRWKYWETFFVSVLLRVTCNWTELWKYWETFLFQFYRVWHVIGRNWKYWETFVSVLPRVTCNWTEFSQVEILGNISFAACDIWNCHYYFHETEFWDIVEIITCVILDDINFQFYWCELWNMSWWDGTFHPVEVWWSQLGSFPFTKLSLCCHCLHPLLVLVECLWLVT